MRILFVLGAYLPNKTGGIENYTSALVSLLCDHDFDVEIAGLNMPEGCTNFNGINVYGLGNSIASFELLLKKGNFRICHFQEYSENGLDVNWFRKAKEHCNKVFFTFHLPYLTCYKGDFRYKGRTDCNTFSVTERCVDCVIADRIKYKSSPVFNLLSKSANAFLALSGGRERLKNKIEVRHDSLNQLIQICDEVFVIAHWFKNLLYTNAYESPKIHLIPKVPIYNTKGSVYDLTVKKKIVFVGRIQQEKGLHLLCKALNHSGFDLELDVYGNVRHEKYFKACLKMHAFNYKGTIDSDILSSHLCKYDFLVLPSVFTEMYPLVITEAFNEQLPVIASSAKGNKELVFDGKNGFIFNYADAADLAATIKRAYKLKMIGWKPTFAPQTNSEKDAREIISYYDEVSNKN